MKRLLPDKLWLRAAVLTSVALNIVLLTFRGDAKPARAEAAADAKGQRLVPETPVTGRVEVKLEKVPSTTSVDPNRLPLFWGEIDLSEGDHRTGDFLLRTSIPGPLSRSEKFRWKEVNGIEFWQPVVTIDPDAVEEFGISEDEHERLNALVDSTVSLIMFLEETHSGMAPGDEARKQGDLFSRTMVEIFGEERARGLLYLCRRWRANYNLCECAGVTYRGERGRNGTNGLFFHEYRSLNSRTKGEFHPDPRLLLP